MSKELIEKLRLMAFESVDNDVATMLHQAADALEAKAAPVGDRDSHWFSLVMNCAAELETASYCMTDTSAKRIAQSGADHYRKQAGAAYQRQQALEVVSDAARDVLAERQRQISAEGMTNAGDDGYRAAELPRAAAAYILNGANDEAPAIWPWAKAWWKPRDARANYVRAGALILAEIERLDRLNGGSHE